MTTVLGIRWIQGYGFEYENFEITNFRSHQAAYGRLKRANNFLNNHNLSDWHAQGEAIKQQDGTWNLKGILYEIV